MAKNFDNLEESKDYIKDFLFILEELKLPHFWKKHFEIVKNKIAKCSDTNLIETQVKFEDFDRLNELKQRLALFNYQATKITLV